MGETREPLGRRRPIIVTVFCALGFIGFPFFVSLMSDPGERQRIIDDYGETHLRVEILMQLGFLVSYVGCWLLKRWGAHLIGVLTVVAGIYYGLVDPKLLLQWGRLVFVSLVMLSCLKHMS
jgi:hypothetical protein